MGTRKIEKWIYTFFGACVGVFSDLLAGWISDQAGVVLRIFFGVLLAAFIARLVFSLQKKSVFPKTKVEVKTLHTENECAQYARKGLITIVSPYKPLPNSESTKLSFEERKTALEKRNYDLLNIRDSNLQPVVEAVKTHKKNLKHCWLISSKSDETAKTGSLLSAKVLADYLLDQPDIQCVFHTDLSLSIDQDSEIPVKTRDMIFRAFSEAQNLGLQPEDIVVDFTGGFKSMTFGCVLACLGDQRDVQYVGTKRDQAGEPGGTPFVILSHFEQEEKEMEN